MFEIYSKIISSFITKDKNINKKTNDNNEKILTALTSSIIYTQIPKKDNAILNEKMEFLNFDKIIKSNDDKITETSYQIHRDFKEIITYLNNFKKDLFFHKVKGIDIYHGCWHLYHATVNNTDDPNLIDKYVFINILDFKKNLNNENNYS